MLGLEDSDHPGLITTDVESLYATVFPAGTTGNRVSVDLYGIEISVDPIHGTIDFVGLKKNLIQIISSLCKKTKLNKQQINTIHEFLGSNEIFFPNDCPTTNIDQKIEAFANYLVLNMCGAELSKCNDKIKFLGLKARLGRFKGSFVPMDLAIELLDPEKTYIDCQDNCLSYRAKNEIQHAFWYLKRVADAFKKTTGSYDCNKHRTIIRLTRQFLNTADAKEYIEFCGAVMRGDVLYGSKQKIVYDIIELRKILGCNNDLGVYDMNANKDRAWYERHGKEALGGGGIAIWLSRINDEVDLVLWIKHQ